MKRIVLPENTTQQDLNQNLGKEKCPECGNQTEVHRPIKRMKKLKETVGIHNFTLKGEDGHTTCLYWEYNHDLPLRVFATPNYPEALQMDDALSEEDNFVAFSVQMKDYQIITGKNIKVDEELTVEKYLEVVRDFIEKHLVWAHDENGDLINSR